MMGKKGKKGKMLQRAAKQPYSYYEAKGLFETGLRPVFPDSVECPPVSSPYGAQTRYDGSQRNNSWYNYHNGMDISLEPGTPLLAVADGTVIHSGSGAQLVGNFIWLHLTPEATGLPLHVFARYQHLDDQSPLKTGDRVKAGDPIGSGGATGTTGGHFGQNGYAHLHLVLYTGPSDDVAPKGAMLSPDTLNYLDPLGLYLDASVGAVTNAALRDLPNDKKSVPVAVRTDKGETIPKGAKVVWPLTCR